MDKLHSELRLMLGERVFLRPDREEKGLFVTDFPRRFPSEAEKTASLLRERGFTLVCCGQCGDMWRIDMTRARYLAMLADVQAAEDISRTDENMGLLYLAGLFDKNDSENLDAARMLLHANGKKQADKVQLQRRLGEMYAYILRTGGEKPGKGCAGLICHLLKGKNA